MFGLLWFQPGRPDPGVSSAALAVGGLGLVFLAFWLRRAAPPLLGRIVGERGLLLVVLLTLAFRLPLAWWGAWGYTTADAALSGIVALHARDGIAHHVFVPSVPYSGSLKSNLTALVSIATGLELVRAFTLLSVLFYAVFAAAAFRLGALLGGARVAAVAGLYAAFAPTFVTQYSLSNDGNYVEVLALGSWALVLGARLLEREDARFSGWCATGVLLGLGFWCHILAIAHVAGLALAVALAFRARAWLPYLGLLVGFAIGYWPGLLWNARNEWTSFLYLVPSGYWASARLLHPVAAEAARPGMLARVAAVFTDYGPVLFGFDSGYPRVLDLASRGLAGLGVLAFIAALMASLRRVRAAGRVETNALLLCFTAANLSVALVALPYIPGNPRYLLFLFAPACALIARLFGEGRRRIVLFLLIAFGVLGSLGQAREKIQSSLEWRQFVVDLRREGVRHCHSDFYLAARITFYGEENPLCSSKLGPVTTEYFQDYRGRVDREPRVDIVAVNQFSAARIEKKLQELGVAYERRDLMKPVLLRLSRRVDPAEIFPGRDFSPR